MPKTTDKKKIIKRVIAVVAVVLLLAVAIYCGDRMLSTPSDSTGSSNTGNTVDTQNPQPTIFKVSGKTYVADLTTLNIAWDEKDEPTENNKTNFSNMIKNWFTSSVISFDSETSFALSGTANAMNDFVATDCEREDNELFKKLSQGNVDVIIYEDKVSFLCDFFVKSWGMYISIDYKLVQEND